jgi:hypothetical protein
MYDYYDDCVKQLPLGCAAILIIFLIIIMAAHASYMQSRGYKLEWSNANGRHVWVDADGKP